MEPNIEEALRAELEGVERRITAMRITDVDTRLLEHRATLIRQQLGDTAPEPAAAKRNGVGRPRKLEARPADAPEIPEKD